MNTDIRKDLPVVLVDPDRIDQVLQNLVQNALQYTKRGGVVTIAASRGSDSIMIAVSDSGIGISAEHMPHLFTRFYRADPSRSRRAGGGSGVGLTIAKYFVEAHGGTISVDSKGTGKGSTFFFTLPIRGKG